MSEGREIRVETPLTLAGPHILSFKGGLDIGTSAAMARPLPQALLHVDLALH